MAHDPLRDTSERRDAQRLRDEDLQGVAALNMPLTFLMLRQSDYAPGH